MKLSLTENDKSTSLDEFIFLFITLIILAAGIALIVFKPAIGFFDANIFVGLGIIMIILAVTYIPCIIYRFATNDKKK